MWSEREKQLIQRYYEEIRQEYYKRSRVPLLATLRRESDAKAPNFLKLGKKFIIPRELFEESHVIIVHPFAEFIELSEYQFLIDTLRKTSIHHVQSKTAPNQKIIDNAIIRISGYTEPDYIIIPIAFYVDLHALSRASRFPTIQYENGQAYYNFAGKRLRILWSNKFINLNEIIIGSSKDGLWLYKSFDGNDRLTVRFYFEEPEINPILLVQTVFRFLPPSREKISVIEFPENLCRVE
jgi:hypothetical protein